MHGAQTFESQARREGCFLCNIMMHYDTSVYERLEMQMQYPTVRQLARPTVRPTDQPSIRPSPHLTVRPTVRSSDRSTISTVVRPFDRPSVRPSERPSVLPTVRPCVLPPLHLTVHTVRPSDRPFDRSTVRPSDRPTVRPSARPTVRSTVRPSDLPSDRPCDRSSCVSVHATSGVRNGFGLLVDFVVIVLYVYIVYEVPEVFPCTTTMCCEIDNAKTRRGGSGTKTGGAATEKNAYLRRWEDAHRTMTKRCATCISCMACTFSGP